MANSIGFLGGVLFIAFFCWIVRSKIESDPEPFFLSFTFFAFAGHFIKWAESLAEGASHGKWAGFGTRSFWLGVSVLLVFAQAAVMLVHMRLTKKHYRELLKDRLKSEKKDQSDRWADVLRRITGVDFFPGGYKWLTFFVPEEPRASSRELAVFALPRDGWFRKRIKADDLIVTVTSQRIFYWWLYVIICLASWILFVYAMIFVDGRFQAPSGH